MSNFRAIRWASTPGDIATRFRDYLRLMDRWRDVLPVPILEISYEETVADLEGVARKLVAWCGLEWEIGCLEFHRGKRAVRRPAPSRFDNRSTRHRWEGGSTTNIAWFRCLLGWKVWLQATARVGNTGGKVGNPRKTRLEARSR